jgi:hypothetical protein
MRRRILSEAETNLKFREQKIAKRPPTKGRLTKPIVDRPLPFSLSNFPLKVLITSREHRPVKTRTAPITEATQIKISKI